MARHNNPIATEFVKLTDIINVRELDFPVVSNNQIDLLIGNDHEELLYILEVRRSSEYCIAAKPSKFGWLLVVHMGKRAGIGESSVPNNKLSCESVHLHKLRLIEEIKQAHQLSALVRLTVVNYYTKK